MDWLTFIASIVKSLAWPVAAVVLAILFKDDLVKAMPLIKRLKAGPVEAEFEREVKELQESAAGSDETVRVGAKNDESEEFLFQLAEFHPRSAILESWVRLEATARSAIVKVVPHMANKGYISAARLSNTLIQEGILNERQVELYHELRRLRNEVAHGVGFEPTEKSARSYIDMAAGLQSHFVASSNA